MFLFSSFLRLLRTEADIVHSLYYTDAYAAYLAGKWKHHRTIYHVAGPPVPEHLPRIPPDRWILKQAIDKADTLMVSSAFTGEVVRQHYDREAQVLPAPIELRDFPEQEGFTPKRPTILSVADFNERRKGVRVLVEAFERVKARVPSALLFLSGQMSPRVKSEVLGSVSEKVRADIEVLGVGGLEDLPQLYQKASVTVLPSMWESYGRVLLESWACGTPVVATNHGGFPELVTDPSTGVLFDPKTNSEETTNSEGLAEAIHQVLALEQDGKTAQRCRSHAEQYSWEVLGGAFEDLYCKE